MIEWQGLATKLCIPPARPALVARPRLLARLDAGLARALTLLSAPAGFGKTTLLAQWLQRVARPVAWLSLDPGDDDPMRFLRYLVAALHTLDPAVGADLPALLRLSHPPPFPALVAHLVNDLARLAQPALLVLDDYHHLRVAAIHQGITLLLERRPPTFHLVITTREDPPLPLARLRARHQLNEVRARHLRFLSEESSAFLTEVMGLPLSGADVAALVGRTEGWIVGLQLAALSLQESEDASAFIADFAGTHRFIVDYLVEEVLEQQSPVVQTFLLQSSLLDTLCAPLCDAVLGQTNSHLTLQALDRANLFLYPLDEQQRWYRYHPLFADLLRHRLRERYPSEVAGLHRRAAAWYAGEGFVREAIQHALDARDDGYVVDLLERHAEQLWMQGEHLILVRWFDALPEAVRRANPTLMLMHAWTLATLYPAQPEPVEAMVQEVVDSLVGDAAEAPLARGMVAVIRGAVASNHAPSAQTLALSQEALRHLPEERAFWRLVPFINMGAAHIVRGELAEAEAALAEAIQLAERAHNPYSALVALRILADARLRRGSLHATAALHERALELVRAQGWTRLAYTGSLYLGMAELWYEWNDLARTRHHLADALQTIGIEHRPLLLLACHALQAWLARAAGDEAASETYLRLVEESTQGQQTPLGRTLRGVHLARLRLARGQIEEADQLAEQARMTETTEEGPRQLIHFTVARVRLAQRRPTEALALLDSLIAHAAPADSRTPIEARLLRALALQQEGRPDEAGTELRRALALAEPEGFVRLFVDEGPPLRSLLERLSGQKAGAEQRPSLAYLRHLLAATNGAAAPPAPPPGLAEPLNARELEVLRLIAEGLSNREIAGRLFLATSTVKWYTHIMYEKLQVHGRTQALARARALGLLDP